MRPISRRRLKIHTGRLRQAVCLQFNAAEGWLELGNPAEALLEWERIPTAQRTHPDVRYLRWRIFASCQHWRRCLAIARIMAERAPSDPRAWRALARSFRELGKVRKAYATAAAHANEFPQWWPLFYDAACYAGALGKTEEAAQLLSRAIAAGPVRHIKQRARSEPDLKGLKSTRQRSRTKVNAPAF